MSESFDELKKMQTQIDFLENRIKGIESLLPEIINLIDNVIQKINPIKEDKHEFYS